FAVCLYLPFVTTLCSLFFFIASATTAIYTLSLHDALPILLGAQLLERLLLLGREQRHDLLARGALALAHLLEERTDLLALLRGEDRKSTRLNSSHVKISYAVFCLKKKKHSRTIHDKRNSEA